jgi:hypothetical protein
MRLAWSIVSAATAALILQGVAGGAQAACDEALAFRHHLQNGSATVTWLNGAALKFRSPLAVNTDGAPNAYHIDGRPGGALNTLCNAGRAMSAVHGTYEGQENCELFLEDVKAARQSGWHGSPRIVWHGIVTKDKTRHEPVVQNSGEYAGYFVSATSLQNKAFREDDQRRYLDARVVPSLVLPRQSAFLSDGGMKLGDLAFVIDPVSQLYTFAVVGDIGPKKKLGEASIALAAAIKGHNIDPKTLTGRDARKLVVPQQVVTVLFPGTAVEAPYDAAQIAAAATTAIQSFGGLDRLKQCAAQP